MSEIELAAVCQGVVLLSSDECRKIVKRKLKTADVDIIKVSASPLSDTPSGFLGEHFRIKITVVAQNILDVSTNEEFDLCFFMKSMPTNPVHRDFCISTGTFKKETDFFSPLGLLYELRKYQDIDNVVYGEAVAFAGQQVHVSPWTCECYLSNSEKLILDDISVHGFRTLRNRSTMDYNHCALALQTLARFHASSIIFEEKQALETGKVCKITNFYPDLFKEAFFCDDPGHPGRNVVEAGNKALLALLQFLPDTIISAEHMDIVLKGIAETFSMLCELVKPSTECINVISHGDSWSNNIMFRYDNANDENPLEVRFVDFQLLRYTPPAYDVICLLHLCTGRQFREKHLLDLALVYHQALREELGIHHIDLELILPWHKFQDSLEYYRPLGILTANQYFITILLTGHLAADMVSSEEGFRKFILEDRSEPVIKCFNQDAIYRERVMEALGEMVEYFTGTTLNFD